MHKDENGNTFSTKGWSVRHKIVSYETCSRNGQPFEEMISVLGIPSSNAPLCSEQLKKKPILHYAKTVLGWEKWSFHVAIGIRADEKARFKEKDDDQLIFQPMATVFPIDKTYPIEWFKQQPFDLMIHPDDGNCNDCWKKDLPRLCRNMNRDPKGFLWWERMVDTYGHLNPRNVPQQPPFQFYRGQLSVQEIRELAPLPQAELKAMMKKRKISPCTESCEAF